MATREEIREGMADKTHLVWQRWMAHMLTHLDAEHIERWKRQANTPYKDLSEQEKESDRSIADEYSNYLHSQGVVIKKKGELPGLDYFLGDSCIWAARAYREMVEQAGYVATESLIKEPDGQR